MISVKIAKLIAVTHIQSDLISQWTGDKNYNSANKFRVSEHVFSGKKSRDRSLIAVVICWSLKVSDIMLPRFNESTK